MKRPLSRTHHLIAGFAGILALSLAQAHAGDWDSLITLDDVNGSPPKYGPDVNWAATDLPALVVKVEGWEPYPSSGGTVFLPLDAFERAGADDADISRLSRQTDANTRQIEANTRQIEANTAAIQASNQKVSAMEQKVAHLEDEQNANVAAMGAIDFQRPLQGKMMRLAMGGATVEDKAGVGLSLSAVKGDWDLSIGVGAAENATVGKGSVGISF